MAAAAPAEPPAVRIGPTAKTTDVQVLNPSLREIGGEASWTLSSAKADSGIDQLREGDLETFWQSDGGFPHSILVQFQKKVTIEEIHFYFDFKMDESYTPKQISILIGSTPDDLVEVQAFELEEPLGWVRCQLHSGFDHRGVPAPPRGRLIQIKVLSMHQAGRDTHVRVCRVYGPAHLPSQHDRGLPVFSTTDFSQYATIR